MKTPFMKKWLATALCGLALGSTTARADVDSFGLGTGQDGPLTVSTSNTVINAYAPVTAELAAGATSIPVGTCVGTTPCFDEDDLVMVLQTTGINPEPTAGDQVPVDLSTGQVGRWEFARLASATDSSLILTAPLVNKYAANVTQVIKVPEYRDVDVRSSGSITAPLWNGSTGGIIVFLANGVLSNNGEIDASGLGFRGGLYVADTTGDRTCTGEAQRPRGAQKGEGLAISRYGEQQTGRGNVANGAGGGICFKSGGGGGGNGGAGGQGGFSEGSTPGTNRDVGGLGGTALIYPPLTHISLGGGGGAGHGTTLSGASGGRGGGAIFIRARELAGAGSISATGNPGGSSTSNAGGGGGAGGSIYLRFVQAATCGGISAAGGVGGTVSSSRVGPGGGGGGGRILLQAEPGGACSLNAIGATPGSQQDPSAPEGYSYGAKPGALSVPTTIEKGFVVLARPTVVTPANGSFINNPRPVIEGKAHPNVVVIIYLDGAEIGRATSNATGNYAFTPPSTLADGPHTVQAVSVLEEQAVWSERSTLNTFTVDTVPPQTTIVSGPQGRTRELNATFEFNSTEEPNVTYECSLDGANFAPCKSPTPYAQLAEGKHTFEVRARDAAGNLEEPPASRSFIINTQDLALLGNGYGCSTTGRDTSLVLMGLGAFAAMARRRRRN